MWDKLRKRYQVQREVAQNSCFEGEIALSELKRLGEMLHPAGEAEAAGKVLLDFCFSRNEFDVPMITGHLQTRLGLECQRCLQPLELPLELDFRLMIDASEELMRQSSDDTLYSVDGFVDIDEVVEDELILALPLVAMHEDTACNENWQVSGSISDSAAKENPFAVLQQLKTTD
jgi:uncharacterized protein